MAFQSMGIVRLGLMLCVGLSAYGQLSLNGEPGSVVEFQPYSRQFVATGGTPPYTFSLYNEIPAGFSISPGGLLTGTAGPAGFLQFFVRVTDSANPPATVGAQVTLRIDAGAGPLTITTTSLPNGTVGTSYTPVINVINGQPPLMFSTTGSMIPGVGIDLTDGEFGGSPTQAGTFTFTVRVEDSSAPRKSAEKSYTVTIASGLVVPGCVLADGKVTQPYSAAITGIQGTAPFSFALHSGALPPGLSIHSSSGVISGTPTQVGHFQFGVRVTDATGLTATPICNIAIASSGPLSMSVSPATLPPVRLGESIAPFTVTASGGIPPYTYTLQAAGWANITGTGVVTGTPPEGGGGVTVEARDSAGNFGQISVGFDILQLDWTGAFDGFVGQAYTNYVHATGFPSAPTSYSIVGGSLPPGLSIAADGSSGRIQGTPTLAGSYSFKVRAALNASYWAEKQFALQILPAQSQPFDLRPLSKSLGFVGEEFYATHGVEGGTFPVTYSLSAGSLPPGLALTGSSVYGFPTQAGSFTFTLRAADSGGLTDTREYTIVIKNPLTVLPSSLPNGSVGQPYTVNITATGGTPPYFFYPESGGITGVLFDNPNTNSMAKLEGTPVLPGTFPIAIRAVDSQGVEGIGRWNVTITGNNSLILSPTTLPNGIAGVGYSQTVFAGAGQGGIDFPVTWSIVSGSLPPGMTTNTSFPDRIMFGGIPQNSGVFSFRLTATDQQNRKASWDYTITVDPQTIQIQPSALPAGTVSVPFSAQFSASGGTAPYTFEALHIQGDFSISAWVTPDGKLQFTPSQAGIGRMALRATDSTGATGLRSYELQVNSAGLSIQPASLPPPTIHQPYSQMLSATGGTAPYTFALVSGALPQGMTLGTGGQITGSPQQAGNFTFGVQAQGSGGESGGRVYSFFVAGPNLTLGPASLAEGVQGQPYAAQITASGGTGPYTFLLIGGTWDAGLQLSPSGQISGSPQSVGTLTPTIEAADSEGSRGSRTFQIVIRSTNTTVLDIQPALLPTANAGQPYQSSLTASNGQAPYTFAITVGALPAGLTLSADGTMQGTPAAIGIFSFTVRAQDALGATGTRNLQIIVEGATLTLTPPSLPAAVLGQPYSAKIDASGGAAPYTFAVAFGQLTHGLQMAADGSISGTPTGAAGLIEVVIRATDAHGSTATRAFQIQVTGGSPPVPVVITTADLPPAQRNQFYQHPLTATGGAGPYAWTLVSGELPGGMQLTGAGVLQGTPSAVGTFPLTVRVSEQGGQSATRALSLTVTGAPEIGTLSADPAELHFSLSQDGGGDASRCLAVFTQTPAEVSFSGPAWIQANPLIVSTPGFFCLTVQAAGLAPGTHTASIVLSSPQTQPASIQIPVTLVIQPHAPSALVVAPLVLKGTAVQGSSPLIRQLLLTNAGNQPTPYTITAHEAWISAPTGGIVPAANAQPITVELNPAGLAPGVYATTLEIVSGNTPAAVQVELVVSGAPGKLALSQSALELVSWVGGAPVTAQIAALNLGMSPLTPEVDAATSLGGPWLKFAAPQGALTPGNSAPIPITADPAGLAPGRYTGYLTVQADEASNGPQYASIGLTVLPAGSPLPADAALSGVALTPAAPHGVVQINVTPGGTLSFQTKLSSDAGWLHVSPSSGLVPANGSLTLQLTASNAQLTPGLYAATLAVGFSDGVIRSIPIEIFVPAAGPLQARSAAADCNTTGAFVAHLLSPTPGFAVKTGRPVTVRVQAEDCTGVPATGLSVSAQYGSQSVTLLPQSAGVWEGTWLAPVVTTATPVQLQAIASRSVGGVQFSRTLSAAGQVLANPTPIEPAVTAVVSAANPALNTPLAPGTWITIFGTNLAGGTETAGATPLPATLGGVEVRLGSEPLRLYYAGPGQVNGLVPAGIGAAAVYQLLLRREGIAAAPVEVAVAAVAPGLFTMNQQGSGQAAALLAGTTSLVAPASPAARGQVIELYASGLGPVANPPADGAAASLVTLSPALIAPQVTIGGQPAQVLFTGLTPGAVGLYQVNVVVPDGAPSGDSVEVRVVQQGVASNTVTIAVR